MGEEKKLPQTCEGCTCSGQEKQSINIEDCQEELLALQRRTQQLETTLASLKVDGTSKEKSSPNQGLRSRKWFGKETDPAMGSIYIERYLNYGMTREELTSGKPIIGTAQSGPDLMPCNRYHLELSKRIREGIRSAGKVSHLSSHSPHPRKLSTNNYLFGQKPCLTSLVEILYAYPLDGVMLLTGCDKITPACLMAAATVVKIPALCLNVGPMINGYVKIELAGSAMLAAGEMNRDQFIDYVSNAICGSLQHHGTASTINALKGALGMALPGSAAIPAPYRERAQCAYESDKQIVELLLTDRKPSDTMTQEAFDNAIVVNSAIVGSTNAIAKHMGVDLTVEDWDQVGFNIPLLLNMQPAGEYLGEEYFRAGGLPAVMTELRDAGKLHPNVLTCTGQSVADNDRRIICEYKDPILVNAELRHLWRTLFNSAIMETCVISDELRNKFLQNPDDPDAFGGPVVVFDGPKDYHQRIEDESTPVDDRTLLIIRRTGPLGYPGAAEVVNMHPPGRLLKQGDGRQSGTSGSPSILNASPEAAAGRNIALLRDVDILMSAEELKKRKEILESMGGYHGPESHTPWQKLFRKETDQLNEGMVLREADKYQRVAQKWLEPRHNH
ncbi:putative dihydroxy acid dehydratase [Talaromyces proteolyticus]|uniref:Dihydroxy acid dehydratase n=1 Tax=Talaromyces proteolyticus TaxID=1131652 RepID=A0AAD4KNG3_9EURO|nr:putative dihydroxy acid dehydratase [Talaromyces proteolyticus]KAH8696687.1 putative dihydroxy acid dehydratase [Talaromyces proteolyticus]